MLNKLFNYFIIIIPLPIFFNLNGSIFNSTTFDFDSFGLPISFVITVLLIFVIKPSLIFNLLLPKNFFLFTFILIQLVNFIVVFYFYNGDGRPDLIIISILPFLLSYLIGSKFKEQNKINEIKNITKKSIYLFSIICSLHILSSFYSLGLMGSIKMRGSDDIFGWFSIYQKLIYYPTILACFFTLSLFQKGKYINLASIILMITILMVGSRESIIIIIFGILSKIIWLKINKLNSKLTLYLLFFITLLIVILFNLENFILTFENVSFLNKIIRMQESGDLTGGRIDVMNEVFNKNKNFNLIFGTGYILEKEITSPHNQYLELFLRSGFFGLFSFLLLLINTIYKIVKDYKKNIIFNKDYTNYSYIVIFLIFVLISFNINTPIRAPYTAILFGFVIGYLNEKERISKHKVEQSNYTINV